MKRRDFIQLSTQSVLGTGILGCTNLLASDLSGPPQPIAPWWNRQWRCRTTVHRPTPLRREGQQVFESAIDFSLLLKHSGIAGEFDSNSIRVVERMRDGALREVPAAYRSEHNPRTLTDRTYVTWYGSAETAEVYFDTKDRRIASPGYAATNLPPENLLSNPNLEGPERTLPAEWSVEPAAHGGLVFSEGKQALCVAVDGTAPKSGQQIVTISQRVDVRRFAGQEMVFQCDLIAKRAAYGGPVAIEIRQFRADGSRIPECAVEARWLCILLAEGQPVQFDERGRFNPEVAEIEVNVRVRGTVKDPHTGKEVSGEDACFDVRFFRFALRPCEQWPWPELTQAGFVAGAMKDEARNIGFQFTGWRRLAFMTASEATLTMGVDNDRPQAFHWGPDRGTLEFWCKPSWNSDDGVEHVFFSSGKGMCCLRKTGAPEGNQIEFRIADSTGKMHAASTPVPLRKNTWHHVAGVWDFKADSVQLFIDGKSSGGNSRAALNARRKSPSFASLTAADGEEDEDRASERSKKGTPPIWSLATQAFVGGDASWTNKTSVEAVIDEFRISDSVRYNSTFTPSTREFVTDESTRALFHLDHERHGVHAGDDAFVRGILGCEQQPQKETASLDVMQGDKIVRRDVMVSPYAPEALFSANRPDYRYQATRFRPFRELPDHRFVEYRERQAELILRGPGQTMKLQVGGDYAPLMRSTSTSLIEPPAIGNRVLLPHWRANRNVVPFSMKDLRATLGLEGKGDFDKMLAVYQYMLLTTNYFNPTFCETLPGLVRKRISYTFLQHLNIYAFDQCGPLNYFLRQMFMAAGISSANAMGTGHQIQQAFFQGDWRLVDNSSRYYCLERDNQTVASRRRIEEDPFLMIRQKAHLNAYLRDRKGEATFDIPERPHNMEFPLRAGETVNFCWHNEGRSVEATYFETHFRGKVAATVQPLNIAKIAPYFGNGTVVFAASGNSDALALENMSQDLRPLDLQKACSFVYYLKSPYLLSDLNVSGGIVSVTPDAVALAVSHDAGRTWTKAWQGGARRGQIAVNLMAHVTSRYEYWLKVSLAENSHAQLQDFKLRSTFMHSPLALPGKLALGRNEIQFVAGAGGAPVRTSCRWVERYKSDLGVALNTISYYMDGDAAQRNLFVFDPQRDNRLALTFLGRKFEGRISIDRLPDGWSAIPVAGRSGEFMLRTRSAVDGETHGFGINLEEKGQVRKVSAQILVARSPLVAEAVRYTRSTGAVDKADLAASSSGKVVSFSGDGRIEFALNGASEGPHALWLRARWDDTSRRTMTLEINQERERQIGLQSLNGMSTWSRPNLAYTKMFAHYGEQFAHWSWYRVGDIPVRNGKGRLALGATAGAQFDALLLLPETAEMDRAAMNLFMNWNYAPWENPV